MSASDDDPGEARYKRFAGISLAVLAALAGWMAILNTNASTNESSTAREATRLAARAQAAAVVEAGAVSARQEAQSERDGLALRPGFASDADAAADLGIALDPDRADARLAAGQEAMAATEGVVTAEQYLVLQTAARELRLTQDEVVAERVTWNARASQYETVMTVLGVALFLIGFSLILQPRIRPPLAVPGLVLAGACFGWALHIYFKPIPDVPDAAIQATAQGQALADNGRTDDAIDAFSTALGADDTYVPALEGRGLARLTLTNPDLLRTFAYTDTTSETYQAAEADLDRALEHGGDEDVVTLTVAALASVGRGDWDRAVEVLTMAIDRNALTPGLQFGLSAAEAGRGDLEAARRWRDRAVDALGPLQGADSERARFAQYATLLRRVADLEPERADDAAALTREAYAIETRQAVGRELTGTVPPDATFGIDDLTFADGRTTIDLANSGVPRDAAVTLVGYELPAEGASEVQPPELFYAGFVGRGEPITIDTPRACPPVAWRFEVYVEGVLADELTHPGGEPAC